MDFHEIEKKWQEKWEKNKAFESNPNSDSKFFVTFPYPYVNLSPHIGHFYTIMRVEAFARYKRLKGYNVLFPQGWHATGSPIVAAAERVKEKESKQIELLKKEGFSNEEIKKFENPEYWIKIFSKRWMDDLKSMGLSIDWRRNFITTSLNPHYDKFIQWQFRKLKQKNYVGKGKHPVVWDPKTNMPVGDHDRIKGEGEVPQELCLFKFKLNDGRNIITATIRPDTLLGITNVYANPNINYKEIEINKQRWIVGEPMIEKLRNQEYVLEVKGDVLGKDLIGKKVESFGGRKILVLPATFLNPNYGTGMVHSVPSDSADDLIALKDLQKNEKLIKKYNLDINEIKGIKPIEIFDTPGIGRNSAQYFLDKYNIKSQNEREKLDGIKKELYKLTLTTAKFGHLYKDIFSKNMEGISVEKGQKIIKQELLKKGEIHLFYELTGEVISRSLTKCVVKIVSDQWFIKYGDEKWKKDVHGALKNMKLYPELVKEQFSYVIDWLNDWACTREYGLGTKLPFDKKWLIESLSDSTIYMAYYTIAHLIKDIPIESINDELFDYIFLNKGKKPEIKNVDKLKNEFEYWYPLDFRNSGKDLIQNHLTFFLFNHIAIFPKEHWPKSIGINGWVKVDGQKMSKSLGNIISLNEMSGKYGADVSRLTILNGGEGMDDPNWDTNFAEMIGSKLDYLYNISINNYNKGKKDKNNNDKWMESELNKIIYDTEILMEGTLFRSAIQRGFFDLQNTFKKYLQKEKQPNKEIINKVIESQLILLNPFCPHICEEIWNKIGKKTFMCVADWPKFDKSKINEELSKNEEIIDLTRKDTINVINLSKEKSPHTYYYVIPKDVNLFEENKEFLKNTTGSETVDIISIQDVKNNPNLDPQNKSKKAKPGKPGIYISGISLNL